MVKLSDYIATYYAKQGQEISVVGKTTCGEQGKAKSDYDQNLV